MKSTTMLSQITTQEDVLFASVTMKQLCIWIAGGILVFVIYILAPRPMELNFTKGIPMLIVAGISVLATVRYDGQLLFEAWMLRLHYRLRPTVITE
jgi:hypothetical protein